MAEKLYAYFVEAEKIGGEKARTKLSILTKYTSVQAGSIADTEDVIKLFEEAMLFIRNEFTKNEKRKE